MSELKHYYKESEKIVTYIKKNNFISGIIFFILFLALAIAGNVLTTIANVPEIELKLYMDDVLYYLYLIMGSLSISCLFVSGFLFGRTTRKEK